MQSSQGKKLGTGSTNIFYDALSIPLGRIYVLYTLAGNHDEKIYLVGINFNILDKEHYLHKAASLRKRTLPEEIKKQFNEYFDGTRKEFNIAFHLSGTDFEKRVWLTLREIPYGQTKTYKWIACKVGSPKGVRAVGQALSRNRLPIVLPCHRVIQSDGEIGGYSSGIQIKRRLLDLEYYNSL